MSDQAGRRGAREGVQRSRIFLSYRRSDSQAWAGRLADDLRDYFGRDHIYRDLDSNRGAQDYIRQIDEAIAQSRVVIAVIGPAWLGAHTADGARRLNEPEDLVRLELSASLAAGKTVVPVLVGGASMPTQRQVPSNLSSFTRLQAHRMSDEDWQYDFGRLLETLEKNGMRAPLTRVTDEARKPSASFTKVSRYERTLQTSRRRAFDALTGTVELLSYPTIEADPLAASVTFRALYRNIRAKVIDAGPGYSKVVVEFSTIGSTTLAGGSIVSAFSTYGVSLLAPLGLRGLERRFAVGFLTNVQRVLEGRGVGQDSAVFPGIENWRNRSREV
jgi:hypothetical protein